MNFHPDIPYLVNLRLECDVKDRHAVTPSKGDCREIRCGESSSFFIMFYCALVYTRCTKINYKIVPVTNFNKHLHYGTSGNE